MSVNKISSQCRMCPRLIDVEWR